MIYKDNSKQNLDTLPLREGYNSLSLSYNFDDSGEILTLTLLDSSSLTSVGALLSEPPKKLSVRIRERGSVLQWAHEDSEDWQTLCDADIDEKGALLLLVEATGFGKQKRITGDGVAVTVSDGLIRFRAREWKLGTDLVTDAYLNGGANKNGGSNSKFNTTHIGEISSGAPLDFMGTGDSYKRFKNVTDDLAPICMNGTYIGANHGYDVIAELSNTTGLTDRDIGSVWQTEDEKYVLVRLLSENKAWFCPYYDAAMENGRFEYREIKGGDTLIHVEGATHTEPIYVAESSTRKQFQIAVNHRIDKAFLNGTNEIDLTKDGYYTAEFVDYYEKYDIIYIPETLKYLIANVGSNTSDSYRSDDIKESYVTVSNTYRYHKNGACVVFASYDFHKNVSLGYIGCVQSLKFDEPTHYVYAPGTTDLSLPTLQEENEAIPGRAKDIGVGSDNLANPDKLTTSYFQLSDARGAKAMNLGYNPLYGTARNEVRRDRVTMGTRHNLGWYYISYKMYPRLISGGGLQAGDSVSCVAYAIPSHPLDDDFTVINWYWIGEDIYLSLHTDKALDKTVTVLPAYMNGMEISVIEDSDSFKVNSATVEDGSISVSSSGAGYAILKLSHPI